MIRKLASFSVLIRTLRFYLIGKWDAGIVIQGRNLIIITTASEICVFMDIDVVVLLGL